MNMYPFGLAYAISMHTPCSFLRHRTTNTVQFHKYWTSSTLESTLEPDRSVCIYHGIFTVFFVVFFAIIFAISWTIFVDMFPKII